VTRDPGAERFREAALGLLGAYDPSDAGERSAKASILRFIAENEELGRPNASGHLTGSALVVDAGRTKLLLNHHAKLDKWMQFGGHVEEADATIAATAFREAAEESGLARLEFASREIFDVDVHLIPERGTAAAHYHYDIRFLLVAGEDEGATASDESKSLRWIPLGEVERYTASESVLRMKRKVEAAGFAALSRAGGAA
jgi:8-oxo-dGTP pyrophosphatase MutT (NUDIX family)